MQRVGYLFIAPFNYGCFLFGGNRAAVFAQPGCLYFYLLFEQCVECVGGLYYRALCKRALPVYIGIAEQDVVIGYPGAFVLLPYHFAPMCAVGVNGAAVVEYYTFN